MQEDIIRLEEVKNNVDINIEHKEEEFRDLAKLANQQKKAMGYINL